MPQTFLNRLLSSAILIVSLALLGACDMVGGAFDRLPQEYDSLSPEARQLVDQALSDIGDAQLVDYHTHIVGMSPDITGTFVNEGWQSLLNPAGYVKFETYKSAAGVNSNENIDQQYMQRLNSLIDHLPYDGRFGIMAFDYFHDEQGNINRKLTTFHAPNEYVLELTRAQPERFFPILSVHPYRQDAINKLQGYAEQGVSFIKWLPNSMGIHPAPEGPALRQKLLDYYRVMQENNMVLISHTGDEKATEAKEFQHLGNPLYLKLALDSGVTVIMAHVGSLGECRKQEKALCQPGTPYLELAIQMMQLPEYKNRLFADISALTQYNRLHALDRVIESTDIHANLLNGSDYPLPAVNFVIQTRALSRSGHITPSQRTALNEIYDINPLLFDYVLKRTIRHSKTGQRLPATIFMRNSKLGI